MQDAQLFGLVSVSGKGNGLHQGMGWDEEWRVMRSGLHQGMGWDEEWLGLRSGLHQSMGWDMAWVRVGLEGLKMGTHQMSWRP